MVNRNYLPGLPRKYDVSHGSTLLFAGNQTVVQSQAAARSNVAKANGESQAIKIISAQLKESPQYLLWLSINRWNSQLPYALSGAIPFFQLPRATTQQNQSNSSRSVDLGLSSRLILT